MSSFEPGDTGDTGHPGSGTVIGPEDTHRTLATTADTSPTKRTHLGRKKNKTTWTIHILTMEKSQQRKSCSPAQW
jgi:hypothetical protein